MNLKGLVLFVLVITTGIIKAQADFKPGYIIKTTGDTVFGQIDYRGDLLMSSVCRFKDKENVITEYSPNDLNAFRLIDSKYFVSREANQRKVFLEYLIKGKVNIYYMRDDIGDHYYLDKEDGKLMEMKYEEGVKYVDGKQVFFETKMHIGLLMFYMQDAPELKTRIASVKKPEHENLIKLAEDYHYAVCKDQECIIYEKKLPLLKISISPFTGLTKFKGYNGFQNESGGYLYLWAPRTSEKVFFKTGLAYHKLSDDGDNIDVYKIPIQIQYIYQAHRMQPNVSAGVNLLSVKLNDYDALAHTFSLNAGLDYKISNKINLSSAFNSDFTTISEVLVNEDLNFGLISYSIIIGLRIDL